MIDFGVIAENAFCFFTVFGPMLNYLPQYKLMHKNRSVGSFDIKICYLLIVSSVLRIIFW